MPKYVLTIEFDTEDELRAHLGADAAVRSPSVVTKQSSTAPESAPAPVAAPEPAPVAAPEPAAGAEPVITDERDADGMPWDEEIHADPKSFTAKGLWRSKRGKSKEAEEARAEFKAAGGAVTAPPVAEETAPAAAMPAPVAAMPTVTEAPLSMDEVVQKTHDLMEKKILSIEGYTDILAKVGASDTDVLNTNETMRRQYFDEISALEAEAA